MKYTFTILLLITGLNAFSQNFTREAGIRGGLTPGFTYRQYLDDNLSYEALLSFRQGGMQFTLLRQEHEQALLEYSENIFFVYGFGAHAGYFYSDYYRLYLNHEVFYRQPKFSPVIGIDAFAGLEYRLETLPLTVALDIKPFFELSTAQFFKLRVMDLALAVKYRF